jgi:hypothetical protein
MKGHFFLRSGLFGGQLQVPVDTHLSGARRHAGAVPGHLRGNRQLSSFLQKEYWKILEGKGNMSSPLKNFKEVSSWC